jgi:hypothetical protein
MSSAPEDIIVEDLNVAGIKPLIPPAILQDELPLTDTGTAKLINII